MNGGGLIGGTVLPDHRLRPVGTAIVWESGRIVLVGGDDAASDIAAARGLEITDAAGATVMPGFVDAHVHLAALGHRHFMADLSDTASVDEVVDSLRCWALADSEELLLARGLDESRLAERRPPTRAELDVAFPERPVVIDDRGLHYLVCNTAAFRVLGFDGGAAWPTGRVPESGSGAVRAAVGGRISSDRRRDALRRGAQDLADRGTTWVHAVEGGELSDDLDIPILVEEAGRLAVDVTLYWNTSDVDAVAAEGLRRMGGDIFIDGSIGSRTAWLGDPYTDAPETRGTPIRRGGDVVALVEAAEAAGVQIAFHAIGDEAIETALSAFEVAARDSASRHRIEHFGVVRPSHLDRAAELGLVISTQPAFPYLRGGPGSVYERRLGAERLSRTYPLADFARSGAAIAGGSDAPVTPGDALLGIQACIDHPNPSQRVPIETAIEWFTSGAAYAAGQEGERGRLEVGLLADIVVLRDDPREVASVAEIPVEMTIAAGRVTGGDRAKTATTDNPTEWRTP